MTSLRLKRYRLPLELNHDLMTEFKAATAINDEKMTYVLIRFIKAYIGKERAELDRLIETYRDKGTTM